MKRRHDAFFIYALFAGLFLFVSMGCGSSNSNSGGGGSGGSDASPAGSGLGSVADPYQIDSVTELQSIASGFRFDGQDGGISVEASMISHYVLTANLVFRPEDDASGGAGWLPIGGHASVLTSAGLSSRVAAPVTALVTRQTADTVPPFTGSLDGRGFVIRYLKIARGSEDNVGLFGIVGEGGTIANLRLQDAVILGGNAVGAIAGQSAGLIRNVEVSSSQIDGLSPVGGIVGENTGTIDASSFQGSLEVSLIFGTRIGGLAGINRGSILASSATAAITAPASAYIGALVGYNAPEGSIAASSSESERVDYGPLGTAAGVNEGEITSPATITVSLSEEDVAAEDADAGVNLAKVTAEPSGATGALTYQIGALGADRFRVVVDDADLNRGWIRLRNGKSLDYEASGGRYPVEVVVSSANGAEGRVEGVIQVANAPENTITVWTQTLSVPENSAAGTEVGSVVASASPEGEVRLAAVETSGFDFNADTGLVTVGETLTLDHESTASYPLTLTASAEDAREVTVTVTIAVGNVFENSITFAAGQGFTIAEDAALSAAVGTLTASAAAGSVRFSSNAAPFAVSETGAITLAAALDYETATSHSFAVTARADDAADVTQTVTITVTNVVEDHIRFADQTFIIAEDAATGSSVGTLVATIEAGDTVTFAATDTTFSVDANSGAITLAVALDYETASSHSFDVTASSSGGGADVTATVTVAVTNVFEGACGQLATPCEIDSLAELQSLGSSFQNDALATPLSSSDTPNAHYVLTADIDAVGRLLIDNVFSGSLDGGGFVLRGLSFQSIGESGHLFSDFPEPDNVALFRYLEGEIKNLGLVEVSIRGRHTTAALVANNLGGTIDNCFVSGSVAGWEGTGALVGRNEGTVQNSFVSGSVAGWEGTGALVGRNEGTVHNSFSSAVVSGSGGSGGVGGLVGTNAGSITSSFAAGDVKGLLLVGGLVGLNTSAGRVQNAFAAGDVSGESDVGGLVGQGEDASVINNAVAYGSVEGERYVGGLIGMDRGSSVVQGYRVAGGGSGVVASLSDLRAMVCAASTVFLWDDDDDDPDGDGFQVDGATAATPPQACSTASAASFPWDFGTAEQLPVLNSAVGGALDAEGQRALLAFDASVLDAIMAPQSAASINAAPLVDASRVNDADGHTLEYLWNASSGINVTVSEDGSVLTFTVPAEGTYTISVTIIERDDMGQIVRVYEGRIALTSAAWGSKLNPLLVDTLEELQSIATGFQNEVLGAPLSRSASRAAFYALAAAIDAFPTADGTWKVDEVTDVETDEVSVEHGFIPIGSSGNPFRGGFDGRGFVISGLSIARPTRLWTGMFGVLGAGGFVENLVLEGGTIAGRDDSGALVGRNEGGSILNSSSTAAVSGRESVGGLVGYNEGLLQDVTASGEVSGTRRVGGLVGFNSGTLSSVVAMGAVSGDEDFVGGLVGRSELGSITDARASGEVSGRDYVGGLVGYNLGAVDATTLSFFQSLTASIREVSASGRVTGGDHVGGLVGWNGLSSEVQQGLAQGAVSGGEGVGGLVGSNVGQGGHLAKVLDSAATGPVVGSSAVGGLIGYAEDGGIRGNFATGSVSGETNVGGLIGAHVGARLMSFNLASGDVQGGMAGDTKVGGLVGEVRNTGLWPVIRNALASGDVQGASYVGGLMGWGDGASLSNALALGSVEGEADFGGVAGWKSYDVGENGEIIDIGVLVEAYGVETAGNGLGGQRSLAALQEMICETSTIFGWDDDGDDPDGDGTPSYGSDPVTPPLDCSTAGAASFPWDFGTDADLPVLNYALGGFLDAAGQRAQLDFAAEPRAETATANVEKTLNAPTISPQAEGNELSYSWGIPSGYLVSGDSQGATLVFTPHASGSASVQITVVERDAEGGLVRVYSDGIALTVN